MTSKHFALLLGSHFLKSIMRAFDVIQKSFTRQAVAQRLEENGRVNFILTPLTVSLAEIYTHRHFSRHNPRVAMH